MPSSVIPKQSDIFDPNWGKCVYCHSSADAAPIITKKTIHHQRWPQIITSYIYYCKAHASNAARDYRAYLHTFGSVLESDVLSDPLFAVITDTVPIVVGRANRTYFDNDGWTLNYSSTPSANTEFVQKDPKRSNAYTIGVIKRKANEILEKNIPVNDLKLSIPHTEHSRVDAFLKRLEEGFYKSEYDEHLALY